MLKPKIKIIFLALFLGWLLFFLSSKTLAKIEEPVFYISLNFQKFLKETIGKIIPFKEEDPFKEKYYQLLRELARLKMETKSSLATSSVITVKDKYFDNLIEARVLKIDALGNIYLNNVKEATKGTIVLDKNFVLIGIIEKVTDKFMIVKSLNAPDWELKVNDLDGNLLGLAKSVSNGFWEVDFVDPNINIKANSFILTAENEIFPIGLIIAVVKDVYYQSLDKKSINKVVAKTVFSIDDGKVYLLK